MSRAEHERCNQLVALCLDDLDTCSENFQNVFPFLITEFDLCHEQSLPS